MPPHRSHGTNLRRPGRDRLRLHNSIRRWTVRTTAIRSVDVESLAAMRPVATASGDSLAGDQETRDRTAQALLRYQSGGPAHVRPRVVRPALGQGAPPVVELGLDSEDCPDWLQGGGTNVALGSDLAKGSVSDYRRQPARHRGKRPRETLRELPGLAGCTADAAATSPASISFSTAGTRSRRRLRRADASPTITVRSGTPKGAWTSRSARRPAACFAARSSCLSAWGGIASPAAGGSPSMLGDGSSDPSMVGP